MHFLIENSCKLKFKHISYDVFRPIKFLIIYRYTLTDFNIIKKREYYLLEKKVKNNVNKIIKITFYIKHLYFYLRLLLF